MKERRGERKGLCCFLRNTFLGLKRRGGVVYFVFQTNEKGEEKESKLKSTGGGLPNMLITWEPIS